MAGLDLMHKRLWILIISRHQVWGQVLPARRSFTSGGGNLDFSMTNKINPGDIFSHHKRSDKYEIVCLATLEANHEPMVVYKALYGEGQIWIRSVEEFLEEVEWEGERVKRFKKIS